MRPRSKSMYEYRDTPKEDDDESGEELTVDDGWTAEQDLRIIRRIHQQTPKNDKIPYEDRLNQICWTDITFDDWNTEDIKDRFEKLSSGTRTFRLLSEILADIEKNIFKSLKLPKISNAFALFLKEEKNNILHNIPEKANFTRVAAETFKNLNEEEKEKYRIKVKERRKSYSDIIAKLNLEGKTKRTKTNKGPTRQIIHAFWEHKSKNGEINYSQVRQMYKNLSKKKKLRWILQFLGVSQGEKLSLDQYKSALEYLIKDELSLIDEYEGRPKKMSAYNIYLKEYFASNNESEPPKQISLAAEKWQTLSKEKKLRYEKAAKNMKAVYNDKFLEFLGTLEPKRQVYEAQKLVEGAKRKGDRLKEARHNKSMRNSTTADSENEKMPVKTPKRKKQEIIQNQRDESSDENEQISENGTSEEVLAVFSTNDNNQTTDKDVVKSPVRKSIEKNIADGGSSIKKTRRNTSITDSEKSEPKTPKSSPKKEKYLKTKNTIIHNVVLSSNKKKQRNTDSVSETDPDTSINKSTEFRTPNLDRNNISNDNSSSKKKTIKRESTSDLEQNTSSKKKIKRETISDFEQNSSLKKRKIKRELTSESEQDSFIKLEGDSSSNKQQMVESFLKRKPPNTVFKYFVQKVYDGPLNEASTRKAYNSLSSDEHELIEAKYKKSVKKYLKELKQHLETLSTEEIQMCTNAAEEDAEQDEDAEQEEEEAHLNLTVTSNSGSD